MPTENESPQRSNRSVEQPSAITPEGPEMIGNAKVLNYRDLAGDEKMVYIRMGAQYYRLTLTRGGRFVLTK